MAKDTAPQKPAPKKGSFKKKLKVAAAAVISLGAGVAGVKFFGPDLPDTPATTDTRSAVVSKAAAPDLPKPVVLQEPARPGPETIPPTNVPVVPVAVHPAHPSRPGTFPEPAMPGPLPLIPSAGPASPLGSPPPLPAPELGPPTRAPIITQAGGTDPKPLVPTAPPMIPTAGPSAPPLPAIPSAGPSGPSAPALPDFPAPSGPAAPALPPIPSAGPSSSVPPPPVDLAPTLPAATPPAPKTPAVIPPADVGGTFTPAAPKLPAPDNLLAPPVAKGPASPPAPVVGTAVGSGPVLPALPPDLGPAPAPAPKTPSTPIKPIGAPPVLPPENFTPQPVETGRKPDPMFTKPDPKPTVTPVAAIERSPTTSFDVDIHEPKAGDTYEAISREFYNDTRFAAALRAYNRNKPLQGSGPIDVPPLHILKRYSQNQPQSGVVPVSQVNTQPEWGSAAASAPVRTSAAKSFRVPTGGMSMRAVARLTMGNEQRWNDIYALNPQLRPDEILPAGTDLRLPADARNP